MENSQAKLGRSISGKRLAVGYVRVSTQRQGDQGISLEAQKAAIREFAEQAEYQLIEIFEDVGSGIGEKSFLNRAGLTNALNMAGKEKAYLLVWDWDRLSRYKSFPAQVLKHLPTLEYVICAKEGTNLKRASDQAVLSHAQQNGEKISERTKKAMEKMRASGAIFGNPEMGSKVQKLGTKAWRTSTDALVRQIADVLRDMGDPYGVSYSKIAEILNAEGIFTQQGNPWNKSRVRQPAKRARELVVEEAQEANPLYGAF